MFTGDLLAFQHLLRTRCRPSPCGRLSRPRTTTEAPPHPEAISRRWACPPPARLAERREASGMVPTFTTHRSTGSVPSSSPAASPRLRRSTSSWPPARPTLDLTGVRRRPNRRVCTADRPRSTRFEPAVHLRGFHHWFTAFVHLSVSLAGPGPSGSADPSRRCQGCFPPSPAPPGSGCPQLQRAAATARRGSPFTSPRSRGASWRTGLLDQIWRHAAFGNVVNAKMSGRAASRCWATVGSLSTSVEYPVELGVHRLGVGLVVDRVQQRFHPAPR